MKLKSEYLTYELDGQQLIIGSNSAFNGLIRGNSSASFIISCLKSETSEEEIIRKMLAKYDADEQTIRKDVKLLLDKLRGAGVLED